MILFCAAPGGILLNVALNKPSWQVSTFTDGHGTHTANRANDGSRKNRLEMDSCAHSGIATNPWWVVDLEKPTMVQKVHLTNRKRLGSSVSFASLSLLTKVVCAEYFSIHKTYLNT